MNFFIYAIQEADKEQRQDTEVSVDKYFTIKNSINQKSSFQYDSGGGFRLISRCCAVRIHVALFDRERTSLPKHYKALRSSCGWYYSARPFHNFTEKIKSRAKAMQRKKGFREGRISSLKGEWQGEDENENDIDRDRCSFSARSPWALRRKVSQKPANDRMVGWVRTWKIQYTEDGSP